MKRAVFLLVFLLGAWLLRPPAFCVAASERPVSLDEHSHAQRSVEEQLTSSESALRVAPAPQLMRLPVLALIGVVAPFSLQHATAQLQVDRREAVWRAETRRRVPRLGDEPPWC